MLVVITADAVGSRCCWELGDLMLHSQPVICPSRWWCTFQVWIAVLVGLGPVNGGSLWAECCEMLKYRLGKGDFCGVFR